MTFQEARDQYVNSTQAVRNAIRDNDVPKMMDNLELVQDALDFVRKEKLFHSKTTKETFSNDDTIKMMDLDPLEILEELEMSNSGFVTGGRSNALIVLIVLGLSDYRQVLTYFKEYDQYEQAGRREAWINQRYKIDCKNPEKVLMLWDLGRKLRGKDGSYPLTRFIDCDFYVSFMRVVIYCKEEGERK